MADHERDDAELPPIGRLAFARGALVGFVVAVPAIATAVYALARLGLGDPSHGASEVLRTSLIFAGLPALLTCGGVARVAARAAARPEVGKWRVILAGALPMAAAGGGLVLLAALPLGNLPARSLAYLGYLAAGLLAGAPVGALIGLWEGAR
jgi:hypothetical protein